jgi:hypothetical protein
MNNTIDLNVLLQHFNKPTSKSRKLTMNDLLDTSCELDTPLQKSTNKDKIRKYRMQGEYGTKKFIKP